jgi:pilus assembly protein Flp/PilA
MRPGILRLVSKLQCLMTLEEGQGMVEYGLIIALIALGLTATLKSMGASALTLYTAISQGVANVASEI